MYCDCNHYTITGLQPQSTPKNPLCMLKHHTFIRLQCGLQRRRVCWSLYCRNIIEKSYSDLELKRREADASQQDDLLREFNSAKEGSWKEERQQRQTLMQQGNASIIVGLCVIIIALLLILVLVGLSVWML